MQMRELEKDRLTFSIVNMLCQLQSAHPLEGTVTGQDYGRGEDNR